MRFHRCRTSVVLLSCTLAMAIMAPAPALGQRRPALRKGVESALHPMKRVPPRGRYWLRPPPPHRVPNGTGAKERGDVREFDPKHPQVIGNKSERPRRESPNRKHEAAVNEIARHVARGGVSLENLLHSKLIPKHPWADSVDWQGESVHDQISLLVKAADGVSRPNAEKLLALLSRNLSRIHETAGTSHALAPFLRESPRLELSTFRAPQAA